MVKLSEKYVEKEVILKYFNGNAVIGYVESITSVEDNDTGIPSLKFTFTDGHQSTIFENEIETIDVRSVGKPYSGDRWQYHNGDAVVISKGNIKLTPEQQARDDAFVKAAIKKHRENMHRK